MPHSHRAPGRRHAARTLNINPTSVMTGALAAATAAALGSRLGVAGTIAGAALASSAGAVTSTLYQHSLERTRHVVNDARVRYTPRRLAPRDAVAGMAGEEPAARWTPTTAAPPPVGSEHRTRGWWRPALATAVAAVAAFVLGLSILTGVETVRGRPLSEGAGATTVSSVFKGPADKDRDGDEEPGRTTSEQQNSGGQDPGTGTTADQNESPHQPSTADQQGDPATPGEGSEADQPTQPTEPSDQPEQPGDDPTEPTPGDDQSPGDPGEDEGDQGDPQPGEPTPTPTPTPTDPAPDQGA